MSWRTVVVSSSAKLDYQMGYLVVRNRDVKRVFLNEIETLMIESTAVSLTTALLTELVKHKVRVVFCDEKRNPFSEVQPYYGSHDTSVKIRNQIKWDENIKKAVWTEIVTEKLRQQAAFLREKSKNIEAKKIDKYITEITFGDETNREGHAAKVYFNALFGNEFTRSQDNAVNAALNYGYSLILSSINREITNNGYLTQLGLSHDNMFNPFNLGSDLMEPFRPLIDRRVIELQPDKFEHEEKVFMLTVLQGQVSINDRAEYLDNAIKIYCKSVFDAINDNDVSLIKFYHYEL